MISACRILLVPYNINNKYLPRPVYFGVGVFNLNPWENSLPTDKCAVKVDRFTSYGHAKTENRLTTAVSFASWFAKWISVQKALALEKGYARVLINNLLVAFFVDEIRNVCNLAFVVGTWGCSMP